MWLQLDESDDLLERASSWLDSSQFNETDLLDSDGVDEAEAALAAEEAALEVGHPHLLLTYSA